jgi:hypothetical protein
MALSADGISDAIPWLAGESAADAFSEAGGGSFPLALKFSP